ncbi:hypothetical protein CEXT_442321 [Caerostris extrusa]|uniref:Uncharacterized protein n=1 Tax=Caerostris extrusa TaxID=172846 RepID=A0AAV4R4G6_CAEEX|nr:hypothetical protein CEXT_442321 [Caerostris extrusa]
MLTLPSRFRNAFHDTTPDKPRISSQVDHPQQTRRRRNTTNRKLISEFAVFPKTPRLRLQERYPVPTVHIEEEVLVERTAIMVGTSRRESVNTPKDSDASHSTTPDNITTTIITNPLRTRALQLVSQ